MRLPRDASGDDLAKALAGLGDRVTRQLAWRRSSCNTKVIPVNDAAIEELKFSVCLPVTRAREVVRRRLVDIDGIRSCLELPIATVTRAGP